MYEHRIDEPLGMQRLSVPQRSTFPLERLQVELRDGRQMSIAFKRLEWGGLEPDARLSKPSFTFEATREPAVYASLLPLGPYGPPRFIGSLRSDEGRGRWLFVEWVQGRELHQVGSIALWIEVARWLAMLHVALATEVDGRAHAAQLPRHDAVHCKRWAQRASRFAKEQDGASEGTRFLCHLLRRYDAVVEQLSQLPLTVIHGDFYASNVLIEGDLDGPRVAPVDSDSKRLRVAPVDSDSKGLRIAPVDSDSKELRIAPVDWEMAAVGSGLLDLAALSSGKWTSADREAMRAAYAAVDGIPAFSTRDFDLVRLHHAVQRLGWAPPCWSAPESQRHDWLTDAIMLAESLEI
jgi:aminoglycoside phosphotransferase (APT) family kinase protein